MEEYKQKPWWNLIPKCHLCYNEGLPLLATILKMILCMCFIYVYTWCVLFWLLWFVFSGRETTGACRLPSREVLRLWDLDSAVWIVWQHWEDREVPPPVLRPGQFKWGSICSKNHRFSLDNVNLDKKCEIFNWLIFWFFRALPTIFIHGTWKKVSSLSG